MAKYFNSASVEKEKYGYRVWIRVADGSAFGIRYGKSGMSKVFDMYFYPYANDIEKCSSGSTLSSLCTGTKYFTFNLSSSGFRPYGGFSNDRKRLLNLCGNENPSYRNFCTALIIYDGWKINKDYPLRF